MNPAPRTVGPPWPPSLEDYDYLKSLIWRDWAWEGLRRNKSYQAAARAHASAGTIIKHMEGGALLTQMQEAVPAAQAWALCSFRRPIADCAAGPPRLVARGRRVHAPRRDRAGLRLAHRE
jgi:hypothetical protein